MAENTLSARLVEIESMLDRSRRRFEEGSRLVEEAHKILGDIQQALIGSPRSVSPEDSEEAASRLLASLKATGGDMPETLCGGRLSVDQVQRLIRIDGGGHTWPGGIQFLPALLIGTVNHDINAGEAAWRFFQETPPR